MITWATTVAPQTQSIGYSTGKLTQAENPGFGASNTRTYFYTVTSFANWSRTQGYTTEAEGNHNGPYDSLANISDSFVSQLGIANSTTFKTRLDGYGGSSSYEYGYTQRSVINTTTAYTTTQYTYTATGLVASTYSFPTLSVASDSTFSTSTSSSNSNVTTSSTASAQETVATTTLGAETIATPILATIVRADKNEVIWAASTSAASGISGQVYPASSVGTSTTQTTIMPWTLTATAAQSPSTATTAKNAPLISGFVQYTETQFSFQATTEISDYSELPHKSVTTNNPTVSFVDTVLSFTVADQSDFIATGACGSETIVKTSFGLTEVSRNGSVFNTSRSYTTTVSREYATPWAETSTFSTSFTIRAYSNVGTLSGQVTGDEYTWTGSNQQTTSNELTTFARQPEAMTVRLPQNVFIDRRRYYYSGVLGEDLSLAAGYSCRELGFFDASLFPEVSRGASSIFPTSAEYEYTTMTTEGEEEVSSQISGSITFSGLNATISENGASTTSTIGISLYGNPQFATESYGFSKVTANLGASETMFETLPQGVYSAGNATFTTEGGATSWSKESASSLTGGRGAIFALSFIEAASAKLGNVLTWTAPRNHSSANDLTQESRYFQL